MKNLDLELLRRHLSSDDAGAVFLRGHLWVEDALIGLIRADLQLPDEWRDLHRLQFPNKVALARAQGSLYLGGEPLLALNDVRNKLAHRVTYDIDKTTAARLLKAFPKVPEDVRSEDPEIAPRLPRDLTPDSEVVDVIREIVLSLVTHLYNLTVEVLTRRNAQQQEAIRRLDALTQSKRFDAR